MIRRSANISAIFSSCSVWSSGFTRVFQGFFTRRGWDINAEISRQWLVKHDGIEKGEPSSPWIAVQIRPVMDVVFSRKLGVRNWWFMVHGTQMISAGDHWFWGFKGYRSPRAPDAFSADGCFFPTPLKCCMMLTPGFVFFLEVHWWLLSYSTLVGYKASCSHYKHSKKRNGHCIVLQRHCPTWVMRPITELSPLISINNNFKFALTWTFPKIRVPQIIL